MFRRERSVFKGWKEPTKDDFDKMFQNDSVHFDLQKLIKDPFEREKVDEILINNMEELFQIFMIYCAKSVYPRIGMLDFSGIFNDCKLYTKKYTPNLVEGLVYLKLVSGNRDQEGGVCRS